MGRSQELRGQHPCGQHQADPGRDGAAVPGPVGPDRDDSACHVLHVDMDAFFASVEVRRRPELRGTPVVVGGLGPRGVVSSASYEARAYGIRSAMPTVQARRLCPRATFLPPDFEAYAAASQAIMGIFGDITPLVEPLSMDEAFLDVSGAIRLFGRPTEIAALIRGRVWAEQRLPCSVGVAAAKFLAKLASTRAKPDGLLVVPAAMSIEFLHPLPVEALWGVGERTARVLRRLGLRTVGEVADADRGMLRRAVGEAAAEHLHQLAWARDPRQVRPERVDKSVGAETTFDVDVADPAVLRRALLALSTKVAGRLRKGGQTGRTVAVKVRLADFRTLSRARTMPGPTDVAREIFETAWTLFTALRPGQRIRLVGVRVEGLLPVGDAPRQLALGERDHGWRDAEQAVGAAEDRFGRGVVTPASLLRRAGSGSTMPDISTDAGDPGSAKNSPLAERDVDPLSDHVRRS